MTPEECQAKRAQRAAERKAKRAAETTAKADCNVKAAAALAATKEAQQIREQVAAIEPTPEEIAAVKEHGERRRREVASTGKPPARKAKASKQAAVA